MEEEVSFIRGDKSGIRAEDRKRAVTEDDITGGGVIRGGDGDEGVFIFLDEGDIIYNRV